MVAQWYVLIISGPEISSIEGPLELLPLLRKISMSPDTLVRKGTVGPWKSALEYEELRPFLLKKKPKKKHKSSFREEMPLLSAGDILVSEEGGLPPSVDGWVWLVVLLLLWLTVGGLNWHL